MEILEDLGGRYAQEMKKFEPYYKTLLALYAVKPIDYFLGINI